MKSTYRSELIRDACQKQGVSLLAVRERAGVHPSVFYRVILGDKRSSQVDQAIIDLLGIEKELEEVDELEGRRARTIKQLTEPTEDEGMYSNTDRLKQLRQQQEEELERVTFRITLPERRLLDAVIQHINMEKIEAGMRDELTSITDFVVKSIRRYNRLSIDGAEPILPSGSREALATVITTRLTISMSAALTAKAEARNLTKSQLLRSIVLWRLEELIEDLELQHLLQEQVC